MQEMTRPLSILLALPLLTAPLRAAPVPNPMPPSSIVSKTLGNGLRVIVRRDAAAPIAVADLWVRAGGADDGGTGAAHALEHMVFKGQREEPGYRVDAAVEETGGVLSASTLPDATHYWTSVPPERLKDVIPALARLMKEPLLDPAAWERERSVILEEIDRARTDLAAEARRALTLKLAGAATGSPVSGTPEAIKRLTPEAILSFWRAFYRPDRTVLVVTGNADPDAVIRAADASLGPLPRPSAAGPAAVPVAPRTGPVEAAVEGAGRIALGIGYTAPAGPPEALDVACDLLRRRLERELADSASSVSVAHPWQRTQVVETVVEGAPAGRDHILAALRTVPPAFADGLTDAAIRSAVRTAQWNWWLNHESPVAQARTLGAAATLGDLEMATLATQKLGMLASDEVREAAKEAFSSQSSGISSQ